MSFMMGMTLMVGMTWPQQSNGDHARFEAADPITAAAVAGKLLVDVATKPTCHCVVSNCEAPNRGAKAVSCR